MSGSRPVEPDHLDRTPLAAPIDVGAAFDGLGEALDRYRSVRAAGDGSSPRQQADLRRAEHAVRACLRALGWRPATEDVDTRAAGPGVPRASTAPADRACADPDWQPARAALELVGELAAAESDSGELVERLARADDPRRDDVLGAAQRCHGLVVDALLVGAVELAARIGVPDGQLPE